MPRLLMLNHNVVWISTFNRCNKIGRELARRGWEVDIFTISPDRRLRGPECRTVQGVGIVEFPDLFTGSLRSGWDIYNAVRRTLRLIGGKKYDMVWAFEGRPAVSIPAFYTDMIQGIPRVTDWTDWYGRGGAVKNRRNYRLLSRLMSPFEMFLEERSRRGAKAVTTVSTTIEKRARELGFSQDRIKVIRTPADTDIIVPKDKRMARKDIGIPESAMVVTFSGFTHYDFNLALETFTCLQKRVPDAMLVTTGNVPDFTKTSHPEIAGSGAIRSFGNISREKLSDVLAVTDVFLLPLTSNLANRARFPARFSDHCAAGRPIVTNPVGDMPAYFAGRSIGVVTDPEPNAMSEAIEEITGSEKLLEDMGNNARKLAENELSPSYCTDELLAFWSTIPELINLLN